MNSKSDEYICVGEEVFGVQHLLHMHSFDPHYHRIECRIQLPLSL